jgi:serine/threonine-protein kinase RCK2
MAHQAHQVPGNTFSAMDGGVKHRGAQAGNVAAHVAGQKQQAAKIDQEDLRKIVDEENASKGKLPRYPGLERWQLIEKMGDGAFSNVYRARDLDGQAGEVAIKVVRKYEMNSNQVSIGILHCLSLTPMNACQRALCVGRRRSSSGFQKAAKSSGGAQYS